MTMTVYDKGDLVRSSTVFKNASDVATDPTTIAVKIEDPSSNEVTYTYPASEVVKDSTGNYHTDIVTDESGTWVVKWIGTGAVAQVDEDPFFVKFSDFA
jgi:hypothetical protein